MTVLRELVNLIGFKVDEKAWKNANDKVHSLAEKMGKVGAKISIFTTGSMGLLAAFSLKQSQEAQKISRDFQTVFASMAQDAERFANTFSKAMKIDDDSVKKTMLTFDAMLSQFDLGEEKSLDMSKALTKMALDFSSFRGLSLEEGAGKINSAVMGLTKGIGLKISDSKIIEQAKELGLATEGVSGEANKLIAKVELIKKMFASQGILGYAEKNMDSFGIVTMQVKDQLAELAQLFGDKIQPYLSKIFILVRDIILYIRGNLSSSAQKLLLIGAGLLALIPPIATIIFLLTTLGAKFLIISGIVIGALALIFLAVEDFMVYMRGGNSIIGKFIEPWSTLGPKLMPIFRTIKILLVDFLRAAKEFVAGIFLVFQGIALGDMGALYKGLEKITDVFRRVLTEPLEKVGEIFYNALTNAWDSFKNYIFGSLSSIRESIFGVFRGKDPAILAQALPKFSGYGVPSPSSSTNVRRQINVNSTIQMQVPYGTTAQQSKVLQDAAETAARKTFEKILSENIVNHPERE